MSPSRSAALVPFVLLLFFGAPLLGAAGQATVTQASADAAAAVSSRDSSRFGTAFTTYNEMKNQLATWANDYPDLFKYMSIGTTYEGRTVYAAKVSDDVNTEDPNEPQALIIGEHHAREIITVEVPMLLIKDLLTGYGKNVTTTRMVNTQQMWFIPMLNPDGHVLVEGDYDWRKNKADNNHDGNFDDPGDGVDLNRNYGDAHWGDTGGASTNPNADDYKGPAGFSENETKAIRDFVMAQNFTTSLSYHSYSELVLYPYGWTSATVPAGDLSIFQTLANAYASYNGYAAIQSNDLYKTTGDSDDWLYVNESVYAMSIEIGTTFYPADNEIKGLYDDNKEASMDNMRRGRVLAGDPSILDGGIFNITVSPQAVPGIVPSNGTADISVKVMNYGTDDAIQIPVAVHVSCVNNTSYSYDNSGTIGVNSGFVANFTMPWQVPFAGDQEYCITATSTLASDSFAGNNAKTVSIMSGKFFNMTMGLGPEDQGALIYPDDHRIFNVTVGNTGNARDSYLISVSGDRPAWATFPKSVELDPEATTNVPVDVTVPRSAVKDTGGHFKINVKAQSGNESYRSLTVSFYVDVGDALPVAVAGANITADIFEPVQFDGHGSTVPIGTIINYTWISSDGWVGYGPVVTHAYNLAGMYDVKLDVTTDLDLKDEDILYVTVPLVRGIGLKVPVFTEAQAPGSEVRIPVNITNLGSSIEDIDVQLTATGLSFDETRTIFNLLPMGADDVEFAVTVPLMALGGTGYEVVINASSRENPDAFNISSFTLTVTTERGLTHTFPKTAVDATGGQDVSFDIKFDNAGNVEEPVAFEYSQGGGGLQMTGPANLTIDPFGDATIQVKAALPMDTISGEHKVPVRVTYIEPGTGTSKTYVQELVIRVLEVHDVFFVVGTEGAITVDYGTVVNISVLIVNNGNVAGTIGLVVDTDLVYEWADANFTLQPFTNRTLLLRIITENEALPHGLSEHVVTVKSDNSSKPVTINVQRPESAKGDSSAITGGFSLYLIIGLLLAIVCVAVIVVHLAMKRKGGRQQATEAVASVTPGPGPDQASPPPPSEQPGPGPGPPDEGKTL